MPRILTRKSSTRKNKLIELIELKQRMEAAIKEKQILKDFNALNKGIRLIFRGPQSPPLGVTDKTKRGTEDDYQRSRTYILRGGSCCVECE